jgi:hypothetical protein
MQHAAGPWRNQNQFFPERFMVTGMIKGAALVYHQIP